MSERRTPRKRRLLRILAWLCAPFAVLGVLLWLFEQPLRSATRVGLEQLLASLLSGAVHIDRVASLSFGGIEAEGVTVIDPAGRPVLNAAHVSLGFDASALLHRTLRFSHGRAENVRVRAYASENTGITLFDAFVPPESPGSDARGAPLAIRFEHIHVVALEVAGDVLGLRDIGGHSLEARGEIVIDDTVHVAVTEAHGTLVRPVTQPVTIEHATCALSGEPFAVDVSARVRLRADAMRIRFHYDDVLGAQKTAESEIEATAELMPVSTDLLLALGVPGAEILLPDLRGYVHLHGPATRPFFSASLSSTAGDVQASGSFGSAATRVSIRSASLALEELIAYAPPLQLALAVDAERIGDAPVNIALRAPTLALYGLQFRDADVRGTYTHDSRFLLDRAHVRYAGGSFDIAGFVDSDANFNLRVRSRVPEVARDPVVRRAGFRAGLTTDLHVVSDDGTIDIRGDIALSAFDYAGFRGDQLHASGALQFVDSWLPSGNFQIEARGVSAYAQPLGQILLSGRGTAGRYALRASLTDNVLGRSAQLNVALQTDGDRYRFTSDDFVLAIAERAPWRGTGDVTLDRNGITFDGLTLAVDEQRLSLKGAYSYTRAYRLDAALERFDLGGLRELLSMDLADLDGTVDGALVLSGVPGKPRVDVHATVTDLWYMRMRDMGLQLKFVYLDERFDLDALLTLGDGSRLRVYADGKPGDGPDFLAQIDAGEYDFGLEFKDVQFKVADAWLAWNGVRAPPGTLSAQLSAQGKLRDPRFALGLQVAGYTRDDGSVLAAGADVRFDGSELAVQAAHVSDAHGELVRGSGRIAVTLDEVFDVAALRASLAKRDFDLFLTASERRIDTLPEPLHVGAPLALAGELHAYSSAGVPHIDGSVTGNFAADQSSPCGTGAAGTLTGDLHIADARSNMVIDLVANNDTARARLEAVVPLSGWIDGSVPFSLPKTALTFNASTKALEEVPVACAYAAGPIDAKVEARDLFAQPPDLTFSLTSQSLQLVPNSAQQQRLANLRGARTLSRPLSLDVHGGFEQERIAVNARLDAESGGSATLLLNIPRAAFHASTDSGPVQAELRLEVRALELAPLFVALPTSTRVSGILNGNARALYDVRSDDVQLSGSLGLASGKLSVAALGQELQDLRAQLTLSGSRIAISTLSARDLTGRISARGQVELAGTKAARAQLTLTLADFPLRREGTQVSRLTGAIDVQGDVLRDHTSLELRLRDVQANLPADLGVSVQSLAAHPAVVVAGTPRVVAPENPYLYDVRIVAQKPPFRVLRSDLNAELESDLTVRYRDPQLTVAGGAEIQRGNFELFGKRFDLEPSSLLFDVPETLDPLVSLHATHRIGGDTIGVRVDGRLSDPKVTFTHSNPAITDTGTIVAQLLGGRAYDPSRRDRDANGAAAGVLAGATAGLLTSEAQRQFGGALPSVSMESGGTTFRGTRIRAGVQLDQLIERRLGPLRSIVRGAYVEGFVAPGAGSAATTDTTLPPQSRGGGLLELRFPRDLVGTVEYRPVQNWRVDLAYEP